MVELLITHRHTLGEGERKRWFPKTAELDRTGVSQRVSYYHNHQLATQYQMAHHQNPVSI